VVPNTESGAVVTAGEDGRSVTNVVTVDDALISNTVVESSTAGEIGTPIVSKRRPGSPSGKMIFSVSSVASNFRIHEMASIVICCATAAPRPPVHGDHVGSRATVAVLVRPRALTFEAE
jgi:hypothetical protein